MRIRSPTRNNSKDGGAPRIIPATAIVITLLPSSPARATTLASRHPGLPYVYGLNLRLAKGIDDHGGVRILWVDGTHRVQEHPWRVEPHSEPMRSPVDVEESVTVHLQRCDAAIDATRVLERGVLWMASDGAGKATTKRSKSKRRRRRVARGCASVLRPKSNAPLMYSTQICRAVLHATQRLAHESYLCPRTSNIITTATMFAGWQKASYYSTNAALACIPSRTHFHAHQVRQEIPKVRAKRTQTINVPDV